MYKVIKNTRDNVKEIRAKKPFAEDMFFKRRFLFIACIFVLHNWTITFFAF